MLKDLSDEQKKMLKELHAKYGIVGKSPLAYVVKDEAGGQTFDITLK